MFSSLIHSVATPCAGARGASHAHKKQNTKKEPLRGLGGVPHFCFTPNLIFCDLKLCAKFTNPRTTPSGRKVCGPERKKNDII